MVYLLGFSITYIIILATCFDSYESSSGINFQELLVHLVLQFLCLTVFFCLSRTIAILMPEDDSYESKYAARTFIYVILKLSKYIILLCRRKYIVDLQ